MTRQHANQPRGDREKLLQAVCEHPGDDAPRLQYAVWLESTGNPNEAERAEFIRIQCELTKKDLPKRRWSELDKRQDALKPNLKRWASEELPKLEGVLWFSHAYRRGFVWFINCSDEAVFQQHTKVIFSSAPIQSLSFGKVHSIKPIVDLHEFTRIKQLILENIHLGPAQVKILANSPNVLNLRELHLSGNGIGDDGVKALAASPHFHQLHDLDLGENGIGDEGVKALAASPVVASLTHLGLAENPLTNAGAIALASSPHLNCITGMTLWDCDKIGAKGQAALKKRFGDAVSFMD